MMSVLLGLLLQAAPSTVVPLLATTPSASPDTGAPSMRAQLRQPPPGQRKPVPFEQVKGAIVFRAMVSGREVWTLLDNGASRSLVDVAFAREAELDPQPVTTGAVTTATGQLGVYRTKPLVFSVPGQIDIDAPEFAAANLGPTSAALGRKIEAVLGAELLRTAALTINFDKGWFAFTPSGRLNARYEGDWVSVPLKQDGYQSVFEASISGKPVQLEFDIGMVGGIKLQPATWRRLSLPEREVGRGTSISGEGRITATKTVRVDEVNIGSMVIDNPVISISPWRGAVDGVIGPSAMGLRVLAIDVPDRKLVFRYITKPGAP